MGESATARRVLSALHEALHSSSTSLDAQALDKPLADVERALAGEVLALHNIPTSPGALIRLQDTVELNAAAALLSWLGRVAFAAQHHLLPCEDDLDGVLARALALVQGFVLLHRPSQRLFASVAHFQTLLAVVDSATATATATGATAIRSRVVLTALDLLLCAVVDSPRNSRAFERAKGLDLVVRVLKSNKAGASATAAAVISPEARIRAIEILYYYLLPEQPPAQPQDEGARPRPERGVSPTPRKRRQRPSALNVNDGASQQYLLPADMASSDAAASFIPQTPRHGDAFDMPGSARMPSTHHRRQRTRTSSASPTRASSSLRRVDVPPLVPEREPPASPRMPGLREERASKREHTAHRRMSSWAPTSRSASDGASGAARDENAPPPSELMGPPRYSLAQLSRSHSSANVLRMSGTPRQAATHHRSVLSPSRKLPSDEPAASPKRQKRPSSRQESSSRPSSPVKRSVTRPPDTPRRQAELRDASTPTGLGISRGGPVDLFSPAAPVAPPAEPRRDDDDEPFATVEEKKTRLRKLMANVDALEERFRAMGLVAPTPSM